MDGRAGVAGRGTDCGARRLVTLAAVFGIAAMYKHILIAIENSESDRAVLDHIEPLARITGARLLLVHVADGWAARAFNELDLRESEEIRGDREYLARVAQEMEQRGFETR